MSLIIGSTTNPSLTVVATGSDQHTPPGDSRSGDLPGGALQTQVSQGPNANVVGQINDVLAQDDLKVEFFVDQSIDRLIVKIVDRRTNEVLAQVPGEAMLATARALADGFRAGVLVDKQA